MGQSNYNVKKYIKSDVYRYYGKCSALFILRKYFCDSLVRFHVALRMRQGKGLIRLIGYALWLLSRKKETIQISPETQIGFGLYIGHAGPIVVSRHTKIGNNVNLSQFTSIGTNHKKGATIGDNTYVGPNVCIVEDVNIGCNVTIGAGSVVTKDIPNNATACGNYAKVINYNNPGRYTMNNRWTDVD